MRLNWDIHEWEDFAKRIGNTARFNIACKKATKEIAKALQEMLFDQTPVKTGQLAAGWGNNHFTIISLQNKYEITLTNDVAYATAVNDGHKSYNQYGGPYEVKHRTVPYTQGNSGKTFVFGHFFVEKSILLLQNSNELENILYKELEKWFAWCING